MAVYNKAIAAFLTGLVGMIAIWVPAVNDFVGPDVISAVSMVAATLLVYIVPNKPEPEA